MMKKIIILILCIQILNFPAFSYELINDSLVEKTLENKKLSVETYQQQTIEDAFVNTTLKNVNPKIESTVLPINDSFVEKTLSAEKYSLPTLKKSFIQDEFVIKSLKDCPQIEISKSTNYNFESIKRIPIKVKIINNITTKMPLREGQELDFKVLNDVKLDTSTTIKKDSIVKARVETISLNQAFGVPADIVIEGFVAKSTNQTDINLEGSVHKIGANRSLWVYPVGYGCTVLFCGAGVVLFAIRGGHAKIKATDTYEVYYVPNI